MKYYYVKFALPIPQEQRTILGVNIAMNIKNDVFNFESQYDLQYRINDSLTIDVPAEVR